MTPLIPGGVTWVEPQRGGPFQVVRDFEAALCDYTGAPYAVTVNSCTMALLLAVAWQFEKDMRLVREKEGGVRVPYRSRYSPLGDTIQHHPDVSVPKRTYVGVPYAIIEAGGRPVFRDEEWRGMYQLKPLPVWDSARLFTSMMFRWDTHEGGRGQMQCVSFHWAKTLGIQQGGAILHDSAEADAWLRRARFDGRTEGVPPAKDTFTLPRAWHCYMSPEIAAEGLVRLAHLPKHNEPLPNDDYPDLSQLEIFR